MTVRSGLDYSPIGMLNPNDRALFSCSARLLSCLVTESLVEARFYENAVYPGTGFAVIRVQDTRGRPRNVLSDVLAIVPLHHEPVVDARVCADGSRRIALLDPLDMSPAIFSADLEDTENDYAASSVEAQIIASTFRNLGEVAAKCVHIRLALDTVTLWQRFATCIGTETSLIRDIEVEFASSVQWQEHSFRHPPPRASFGDPSFVWEQSIVQGHPTHPMHKTRRFLPPMPNFKPGEFDLSHPTLRLIAVPRKDLKITFNFEELVTPVLDALRKRANKALIVPEGHVAIPIHELQLYHIREKFPEAYIFPEEFALPLQAQQSLRSVVVPDAFHDLHLKLATGMKLTSAVRTISPESAYLGPRFSAQVVPVLKMDPAIVTVARELASVVHAHPDGEIAKHCAALVREYHEGREEERGECMIVCTSLVEHGHNAPDGDVPPVIQLFGLDTEEKRLQWLAKFLDIFFRAFLPSVIQNGVAFECHPQNCVARFDARTKELKGFIIRDFGGIKVHPPTLKKTTGVDIDFVEGHSIVTRDLDDVYTRMYHTVFHNHLQQLIRVLDLHYNGKGWALVRDQLRANIPIDHPLYTAWLSPQRSTLPGKCFMRMRLSGMYRFHLHGPFPNLIHYQGTSDQQTRRKGSSKL